VLAAALALLASITWGASDFMAGLQSRRMSSWAVVLVCTPVAALGSLLMVAVLRPPMPSSTIMLVVVLGGASSAVSGIAYFKAVTITKMSVVAPILAGAAVLPVLWGLVEGDQPGLLQVAGIVATLAGIVVISRPGPTAPHDTLPVTGKGVALGVAASLTAGLLLIAMDTGADTNAFWAVAGVRVSAALWTSLWIGAQRPELRFRRRSLPILIVIGLMVPLANTLFASASAMGDLSVVAVLGWLSPAVTVLLARVVLHEHLRPLQWAAAATVLTGVVCLALG
jgi:drug/metabolite transporter (DMT)-like permease